MFFNRFRRYKSDNTRRYPRLPADWLIKCSPLPPGETRSILSAKDISAGGIAIAMQGMIPVGSILRIEVHVPPLNRSISTNAQVVRCVPSGSGFEMGLRFLDIDPKDQEELHETLQEFYGPVDRVREQGGWWRKLE